MNFKKEFWVLLSIFILPVGLGTLFFYLNPTYFSQNTVNYGELIRPVIVTEKSDIEVIGDESLEGVWTLVYVTDSCDSLCDEAIEDIDKISIGMDVMAVGLLSSFLVGLVALKWLLNLLKTGKFYWFGVYCLLLGIIAACI